MYITLCMYFLCHDHSVYQMKCIPGVVPCYQTPAAMNPLLCNQELSMLLGYNSIACVAAGMTPGCGYQSNNSENSSEASR